MNSRPLPYHFSQPPPSPVDDDIVRLRREMAGVFDVEDVQKYPQQDAIAFSGTFQYDAEKGFDLLQKRFQAVGYTLMLRHHQNKELVVAVSGAPGRARTGNPLINFLLLVATALTTLAAGASQGGFDVWQLVVAGDWPMVMWSFWQGLPFAVTLLSILGIHELGHYVAARWHGVAATLPYFVPLPFGGLGTLGAFIALRSPMKNRKVLFDIGIAGPLAGFLVAVPMLLFGLLLSPVASRWPLLGMKLNVVGSSLLVNLFVDLFKPLTAGETILMHPIFFAAWIGLLITGINLLPVGQLDGGHIAYALFGARAHAIARLVFVGLIVAGMLLSSNWLVWAFLVMFSGLRHPPPLNDLTRLDWPRQLLGWMAILLFFLVMVPRPFGR